MVAPDEVFRGVRRATGAFRSKPEMATEYLLGGVDVAVDAVGSKDSIDTVLRARPAAGWSCPACRRGGDLSPVWFRSWS